MLEKLEKKLIILLVIIFTIKHPILPTACYIF
jgi:hypothetical protein